MLCGRLWMPPQLVEQSAASVHGWMQEEGSQHPSGVPCTESMCGSSAVCVVVRCIVSRRVTARVVPIRCWMEWVAW